MPGSRSVTATLILVLLLFLTALAPVAQAAPSPEPDADAKIESDLAATLAEKDSADFYVEFTDRADLTAAAAVTDWAERGAAVVRELRTAADSSQADLNKELDEARIDHTSFWITNAILVHGGTRELADGIAEHDEVAALSAPDVYQIPESTPGEVDQTVNAVEWGIDRIRADDVWSTFGVRGEGIVVGSIDTGVDFRHPALVRQYRGNTGDAFSHDYNWFDPARVCALPEPCDNNDHGTHTMGTMVGSDGANQIGVAPGARWITAKGCETNTCTTSSLLASGQWMLAPTRLDGTGADASRRPHIINNSWGGAGGATWYPTPSGPGVRPACSRPSPCGNSGPACGTAGSPGDDEQAYASGYFDVNNAIASLSSRGAGPAGRIKPDVAAPGVNVRSSVPGGGYASLSGSSMASPHTAGTVALMWAAAPTLAGTSRARSRCSTGPLWTPRTPAAAATRRTTTSGARDGSMRCPPSSRAARLRRHGGRHGLRRGDRPTDLRRTGERGRTVRPLGRQRAGRRLHHDRAARELHGQRLRLRLPDRVRAGHRDCRPDRPAGPGPVGLPHRNRHRHGDRRSRPGRRRDRDDRGHAAAAGHHRSGRPVHLRCGALRELPGERHRRQLLHRDLRGSDRRRRRGGSPFRHRGLRRIRLHLPDRGCRLPTRRHAAAVDRRRRGDRRRPAVPVLLLRRELQPSLGVDQRPPELPRVEHRADKHHDPQRIGPERRHLPVLGRPVLPADQPGADRNQRNRPQPLVHDRVAGRHLLHLHRPHPVGRLPGSAQRGRQHRPALPQPRTGAARARGLRHRRHRERYRAPLPCNTPRTPRCFPTTGRSGSFRRRTAS